MWSTNDTHDTESLASGKSMASTVRAASPYVSTPTYGMTLYLREYCAACTLLSTHQQGDTLLYRILTHLKEPDRSRSLYLSFCTMSIVASSFLRTMRSQITTVLLTFKCLIFASTYNSKSLTPCALVYSASRYTNNCFVFQLKSGVKSGAARSDRKIRSRIRNRDCATESGGSPVRLIRCHRDECYSPAERLNLTKPISSFLNG